jgi:hypothetical protein
MANTLTTRRAQGSSLVLRVHYSPLQGVKDKENSDE